jgi:hypothetical protein
MKLAPKTLHSKGLRRTESIGGGFVPKETDGIRE